MLNTLFLVGIGGAMGAITRFLIQLFVQDQGWAPWGIFVINVLGCFLIGLLMALLNGTEWFKNYGHYLIVVGFLGAFTTFSAFSWDTLQLVQDGRLTIAFTYVVATVGLCLVGAWLGYKVAA